jgi:hypothetical protein
MSTHIHDYHILDTYAVLANSGISAAIDTSISNGFYGSSPTASYSGPIFGTAVSAPQATNAQTELTDLITAINTVTVTDITTGGGTHTYGPGRHNSMPASTIIFTSGAVITLDAGGDSNAQFFFTAGSAITFDNVAQINLINGASTCNVFWVAESAITFAGTSPTSIPGIFIAGTAITFATASQISGRVYAKTAVTFSGTVGTSSSVDGACFIVCYAKGTLILTKQGYVPIEDIRAGNKVVTKGKIIHKHVNIDSDVKIEPVIWISKFKVTSPNSKSRPICIKKDTFGKKCPFKDLYVSPGHRLLLNGKMVLAQDIINGETIYQDNECDSVEYYHLECEHHSGIFANGVLAETYLDINNNRRVFEKSVKLDCSKLELKKTHHTR